MQQWDGRVLVQCSKISYNDVRFMFPRCKVPCCFRYRTTETTKIAIALPSHSHVLGFAFYVVLSPNRLEKYDYLSYNSSILLDVNATLLNSDQSKVNTIVIMPWDFFLMSFSSGMIELLLIGWRKKVNPTAVLTSCSLLLHVIGL